MVHDQDAAAAAATKNIQVAAARSKPDTRGKIDMGSQRCVATTLKGQQQCSQQTRHGYLCRVHRAQIDGTCIKASSVPGAEKGLWAETRSFKKGKIVARYTGDLVPTQAGKRRNGFGGSHYVLELSDAVSIDAARTNTADGRMVNDARGSGRQPNACFRGNQRNKTATVVATRTIKKGEEVLVNYGYEFWNQRLQRRWMSAPLSSRTSVN